MRSKTLLITAACLTAVALGTSPSAWAKGKKSPSPSPSAGESASPMAKASKPIAYHGKIASVDATAKSFTVGSMTIKVTDDTKITKQGAAATMADIVADEDVRGSYW